MSAYPFSLLQVVPDIRRGEAINAGIVVFLHDRIDVRVHCPAAKVRALKRDYDLAALAALASLMEELDREARADGFDIERRRTELTRIPGFLLTDLGYFTAGQPDQYEPALRRVMAELVDTPPDSLGEQRTGVLAPGLVVARDGLDFCAGLTPVADLSELRGGAASMAKLAEDLRKLRVRVLDALLSAVFTVPVRVCVSQEQEADKHGYWTNSFVALEIAGTPIELGCSRDVTDEDLSPADLRALAACFVGMGHNTYAGLADSDEDSWRSGSLHPEVSAIWQRLGEVTDTIHDILALDPERAESQRWIIQPRTASIRSVPTLMGP